MYIAMHIVTRSLDPVPEINFNLGTTNSLRGTHPIIIIAGHACTHFSVFRNDNNYC